MKKRLFILLLAAVTFPMLLLSSCSSDGPLPEILVVAERNTGKLYKVNPSTAAKTEIGTVTLNGDALQQLRGMVYNTNDKKLYASTTADGDGVVYTINPATLAATEFNTDPDDYWYGIADLLVTSDNQILGTLWYRNPEAAGLVQFNLSGEFIPQALFSIQDICCGMGMVFGENDAELMISTRDLKIYTSDFNGEVALLTTLVPDGFDATDASKLYIQNMVKFNNKIYAVVYDKLLDNTHLAEVDLAHDLLINLGSINQGNNNHFHALMSTSESIF
ncbi:MAG: hypothetical protein OEV74_18400 [Cyclobacteriaceae bacterium]|nr:hypothetical protein [Cyclobacteriaceae bacterium]MDH4298255.1 hypothetical protein [Cyclobacteriaceae bacterium]MDH5249830.1 hypothetical protein [Cyclobacteriaceae bacterium]